MAPADAPPPARRTLRRATTAVAALAGAALAAWLLAQYGAAAVARLLLRAGWGIFFVIALHGMQLWLTAIGWRALMPAAAPSRAWLTTLRMVREGVNTLVPSGQIGGLVAAMRLLGRHGLRAAEAVAATVVDISVELVTQIVFTLLGLALLVVELGHLPFAVPLFAGVAVLAAMLAALLGAQRFGLFRLSERVAARFGLRNVEGLHEAVLALYRRPARLAWSAACHLLAWALGAVEVCVALHFLGQDIGPAEGFVIESLGQTIRAASFAIPAALGVQEGGYVLLCGLFAIPPDAALALSLVKRLRELCFAAPSLMLWQRMEAGGRPAPITPPGSRSTR
jgi:putative membrane protein